MNTKFKTTTNTHLRILEVVFGFILFAWGAYCFVSWAITSDFSSFKLAMVGFAVGCLLFFDAHRAGKKAVLVEQSGQNQSPESDV